MDIQEIKDKIVVLEYKLNELGYVFSITKDSCGDFYLLKIINYTTKIGLEERIEDFNFNDFKIYRFLNDFYKNEDKIKRQSLKTKILRGDYGFI